MKYILTYLLLLVAFVTVSAQSKDSFLYQVVVYDEDNKVLEADEVDVVINVLQGSSVGVAVYSETQKKSTNSNGLLTLNVGKGTVLNGVFNQIDWGAAPHFISVEVSQQGQLVQSHVSQLLATPYALYTEEASNGVFEGNAIGDMRFWNGTTWSYIPSGKPGQLLQLNRDGIPSWTGFELATVITHEVSNITFDSAISGGNVTHDGGSEVVEKGVIWSTTSNAVSIGNRTNDGSGLGVYTSRMTLLPNTTYYVRAYARTNAGMSLGNEISFTTPKITYYQDLDGDGFGSSVTQLALEAPTGYVAIPGDCNDLDASINPNALEICNNAIDENCNGYLGNENFEHNHPDYETIRTDRIYCDAMDLKYRLEANSPYVIATLVGENGKIFGSITPLQVANAIRNKGMEVDRKQIDFVSPYAIKTVGEYEVNVELTRDISARISILVVGQ